MSVAGYSEVTETFKGLQERSITYRKVPRIDVVHAMPKTAIFSNVIMEKAYPLAKVVDDDKNDGPKCVLL